MSILVIDVGTSGVRAAIVRPDATVTAEHRHRGPALDAGPRAGRVRRRRHGRRRRSRSPDAAWPRAGPVDGVGIANQRASTIVWDRATGHAGRRRGSAGRTCAPSATAWSCRPRASGSPPTSRPPRPRTCSTRPTPTRHATSASARSTRGSSGTSPRAGSTPPTSPTPASPACSRPTRPAGTTPCSTARASPPARCPPSSTRAARSARPPPSPARP